MISCVTLPMPCLQEYTTIGHDSLFSPEDEEMLTCKFGSWWELMSSEVAPTTRLYFHASTPRRRSLWSCGKRLNYPERVNLVFISAIILTGVLIPVVKLPWGHFSFATSVKWTYRTLRHRRNWTHVLALPGFWEHFKRDSQTSTIYAMYGSILPSKTHWLVSACGHSEWTSDQVRLKEAAGE